MSLFSPGVTWQIGEAKLVRVDSEYPPPRFVYWPTPHGPSALLGEPEAREVLASMILSGDSQRAALLTAIATNAHSPEAMFFDVSANELLEQFVRACPDLVEQVAIVESLDGAVDIIIEALGAGHRIEWAYREMMFDWSIDPDTGELLFVQDNGEHSFTRRVPAADVAAYIRRTLSPDPDATRAPDFASNERMYISQAVRLLGAGTLRAWMLGKRA